MIVSNLYEQTAQLGFEESLEYDRGFLFALNRAILQVAETRPATRICQINHSTVPNAVDGDSFNSVTADGAEYTADGVKAFYFECDGEGTAYIEKLVDGEWETVITIHLESKNHEYLPYKGMIDNGETVNCRIRFESEYICNVRHVAMYAKLFNSDEASIPAYTPYIRYDIKAMVDDFMSLESPPFSEIDRQRLSDGYDIEDGHIILMPHGNNGVYNVIYRHLPSMIETDDPSSCADEIDLDEDLCELLPYLIAAFVWADDEPDLSNYYLQFFRERQAFIMAADRKNVVTPVKMVNKNGW